MSALEFPAITHGLRHIPVQARSRRRLARMLDVSDELLAREGAAGFTMHAVARAAHVPVGSVYHYFEEKESLVEALALRYWNDLAGLVAEVADEDERAALEDPAGDALDALATGFRATPGFLALWYSELRTHRVRAITRPTRVAIGASVARIFAVHWPDASDEERTAAARMVVLAGDGLLREAFRSNPVGDDALLAESRVMLSAYVTARLGPAQR